MNRDASSPEQTIKDLLILIGVMQQREERLRQVVNEQLQILHAGVQRAGGDVNRVVESAMPRLTQLSQQALASTLNPAAQKFEQTLQHANKTLQAATSSYVQAQQRLTLKASRGMFLATAALGLAALVAAGAGGYLLFHVRQEVARLQPQVEYLEAINRADWVPCGEGRLCARVEEKGQRYGARKDYSRIEVRQ